MGVLFVICLVRTWVKWDQVDGKKSEIYKDCILKYASNGILFRVCLVRTQLKRTQAHQVGWKKCN